MNFNAFSSSLKETTNPASPILSLSSVTTSFAIYNEANLTSWLKRGLPKEGYFKLISANALIRRNSLLFHQLADVLHKLVSKILGGSLMYTFGNNPNDRFSVRTA